MTDLTPDVVELVACPTRAAPAGRLHEIAYRADAWTPDEVGTLERLFRDDVAIEEIASAIGRRVHGVRDKIATLGLRRNSQRTWSEAEDAWLTREYGSQPASVLAQDLGRGCTAIYARAGVLGLTEGNAPRWTDWEDAQLRAGFERAIAVAQIAALIGRPLSGTITRASTLGLRHPNNPPGWTEAEAARALTLAAEGHRYLDIIERMVAEGFPRRTKAGFGPHLRKLGYGRGWGRLWTPDEDALLSRVYTDGTSRTPLIERLGRSTSSINWRVDHLGLRGTHANRNGFRGGPIWTEADITTLRDHYGKMPMTDLAAKMGRTKASLFTRANLLGLVHGYHRPWSDDDRRALALAHAHDIALPDLATALGRKYAAVHKFAEKQGVRFGRRARRKPAPTLQDILGLSPRP